MSQTYSPRIGVVLSSGGNRGVYAHTGFLLALEAMGIPVAAVAGCSAGAIVGGVYASGTDLKSWAAALEQLKPRNFWQPDSWAQIFWQLAVRHGKSFTGISGTEAAMAFCRSHLAAQDFESCKIPFHALAVCLDSGSKVVFSQGELAPRIVASSAMPLLYRPVEIDGEWYCDGAVVELAPTDAICCKHQLDVLIVHHVASRGGACARPECNRRTAWPMVAILDSLLFRRRPWYLSDKPLAFHRCPCGCKALIVVIEPDLPELPWPETKRGPEVQAAAKNQAQAQLTPYLHDLLGRPQALHPLAEAIGPESGKGRPC